MCAHAASRGMLEGRVLGGMPYIVVVSCLLHNFLVKFGEPMPDDVPVDASENVFVDFEGENDREGEKIQDVHRRHRRARGEGRDDRNKTRRRARGGRQRGGGPVRNIDRKQ